MIDQRGRKPVDACFASVHRARGERGGKRFAELGVARGIYRSEELIAALAEHVGRAELAETDAVHVNAPGRREPIEIARHGADVVVFRQDPGVQRPVQVHRIGTTQLGECSMGSKGVEMGLAEVDAVAGDGRHIRHV